MKKYSIDTRGARLVAVPGKAGICGRLPRSRHWLRLSSTVRTRFRTNPAPRRLQRGHSSGRRNPRAAGRSQLRGRAGRGYPAARNAIPRVSARRRPPGSALPRAFQLGFPERLEAVPAPPTRASRSQERSLGSTHRPGRQRGRRTAASGLVTAPPAGGVHTRARWRLRRRGQ